MKKENLNFKTNDIFENIINTNKLKEVIKNRVFDCGIFSAKIDYLKNQKTTFLFYKYLKNKFIKYQNNIRL